MRVLYCIWALALLLAQPAAAQQAQSSAPGTGSGTGRATANSTGYTVFLRGQAAGRETVRVDVGSPGLVVSSEGQMSAPINATLRRAEVRYAADWSPQSLVLESVINGGEVVLRTTFKDGQAISEGTQLGQPMSKTDTVSPQTLVLPNTFWGAYAAVARRLTGAAAGAEYRVYVAPISEIGMRVTAVTPERVQVGTETFPVRRYDLLIANPGGDLAVAVTATESGDLIRVTIPAGSLDVIRDDVASANSRTQFYSNPGDEPVTIPGAGFNIGATLTRPRSAAAGAKLPAVVLHGGSGVSVRGGTVAGIPTLGQLAGALADAGFLVVRYDKRGYGQTGGRAESATISDFADDMRAVAGWLEDRKDVDSKRIAVVGHSEGAWVALLAASREKDIAAVVSLAGPASTGAELVLEQQQHGFDLANAAAPDRAAKVAAQQQLNAAVLTGKGWEGIPEAIRKQADTPWFQSLLAFNPAQVVDGLRQPLLVVQGALDRQVPVEHAERLAQLARSRGKSKVVDVVTVPGVNHLLVPATTGEVAEYGSLPDRNISRQVSSAVAEWLTRTMPPKR
jgi:pimeloyl-ACP methyl ester carboxylesterase